MLAGKIPAGMRPQSFRFGPFGVDVLTGELRKAGTRIRLQKQSAEILLFLLQQPGQLVTREELRRKLWPDGVFVDFDHALNAAVNRLRVWLGDTAEKPRFIETLPGRGYRFIGPVETSARVEDVEASVLVRVAESLPRFEAPPQRSGRGLAVEVRNRHRGVAAVIAQCRGARHAGCQPLRIRLGFGGGRSRVPARYCPEPQLSHCPPMVRRVYALGGTDRGIEGRVPAGQGTRPLSPIIARNEGLPLFIARRYDEYLEFCRKTLAMDSTFWPNHFSIAWVYELKNDWSHATAEFETANRLSESPLTLAHLAHAYARGSRRHDAEILLGKLKEMSIR